jgi:hypothetical protein
MITIPLNDHAGGMSFHEIKASSSFEMFGFTFATHRSVMPDGSQDSSGFWVVSEVTCGAVIRRGDTRKEAIASTKETLLRVGEEKLRKEVKRQLRQQKKAGRIMP